MASDKRPGWGLVKTQHIMQTRIGPHGQQQALICPDAHEAPFWIDLQHVAQFNGRIIYNEISPCQDTM